MTRTPLTLGSQAHGTDSAPHHCGSTPDLIRRPGLRKTGFFRPLGGVPFHIPSSRRVFRMLLMSAAPLSSPEQIR